MRRAETIATLRAAGRRAASRLAFVSLALLAAPSAALAAACPFLDEKSALETLLATRVATTVEKRPVPANAVGGVSSTLCRFQEPGELMGQLTIVVTEFGSAGQALAAYETQRKEQASRARPAKVDGNPGFFTQNRGFSAASYTVKGKHFVFVSHPFSKRVNEAIAKDPDGGPLSTHEIARRVLSKL